MQENVTYPGGNPFVYPSPPFPVASAPNPTNTPNPPAPGSAGSTGINDTHYIPGGGGASSFVKPYSGYQVTATQYEQYKCGNQTTWTNFYGPAYIYRTIGQNS